MLNISQLSTKYRIKKMEEEDISRQYVMTSTL